MYFRARVRHRVLHQNPQQIQGAEAEAEAEAEVEAETETETETEAEAEAEVEAETERLHRVVPRIVHAHEKMIVIKV